MLEQLKRFYCRKTRGPAVVVVSGLPRSGTSMAMEMLEAGGMPVYVDGLRKADIDNPKGYFEFERVKQLHTENDKTWVEEARGKAIKVISHLIREMPASCFYRVVFMNRDLDEVIASQNKMLERRGDPVEGEPEQLKETFDRHLRIVKSWLERQVNFEVLHFRYVEVLADPEAQARRMREFLRVDLDVGKMAAMVDPELYRNRSKRRGV